MIMIEGLNNIHFTIKFTSSHSSTNIPFLDVTDGSFFPTSRYCAHYEANIIYNPYATESCLLRNTHQKKD